MIMVTVCILTRNELLRDLIKVALGQCESLSIKIVERLDDEVVDAVIVHVKYYHLKS